MATAKNNHPDTKDFALLTSQRRTKFLLAISRDEDPRHGFRTYGFNATPNDGACGKNSDYFPCPGSHFTPGNAADYPSLGVSKTHYIMTIGVGHAPLDGSPHNNQFSYMATVNADDAANGKLPIHMHAIWHWDLGEGDRAVGVTMPAINAKRLAIRRSGMGRRRQHRQRSLRVDRSWATGPSILDYDVLGHGEYQGAPDWTQKDSDKPVAFGNVGD